MALFYPVCADLGVFSRQESGQPSAPREGAPFDKISAGGSSFIAQNRTTNFGDHFDKTLAFR
ncbi:MAG: hypothetical protein OEY93_10370 [Anaerolineae bacterium]|nr:hypothetical protein [Anaerolineae bacterium]